MLIKVIKVTKNGKVGYLNSSSMFGGFDNSPPIVDTPIQAKNYAIPDFANDLEQDIANIRLPNKPYAAMSGVSVDTAQIVEIEVTFIECSIKEAYIPN